MQASLSFIGIILVVFSGSVLGRLLLFIAPEENKPGKGWFRLLSALLFSGALFTSTQGSIFSIPLALGGLLLIVSAQDSFLKDRKVAIPLNVVLGMIVGLIILFSSSRVLTASLLYMFMISYSSLTFFPDPKDVNLRRYQVKRKMKYILDITIPLSSILLCIPLYFLIF